jgi:hypothetical protein
MINNAPNPYGTFTDIVLIEDTPASARAVQHLLGQVQNPADWRPLVFADVIEMARHAEKLLGLLALPSEYQTGALYKSGIHYPKHGVPQPAYSTALTLERSASGWEIVQVEAKAVASVTLPRPPEGRLLLPSSIAAFLQAREFPQQRFARKPHHQ